MKAKKINWKRIIAWCVLAGILLTAVIVLLIVNLKKDIPDTQLMSYGALRSQELKNTFQPVAVSRPLTGYEAVSEDSQHILFIQPETTNIAIMNKSTNKVWYGAMDKDHPAVTSAVNDDDVQAMLSQIVLTVYDAKGNKSLFPSYEYSVSSQTFGLQNIPDGVRVEYLITDAPKPRLIPAALLESRYEELLAQMAPDEASIFKAQYMKLEFDKLRSEEREKILKEFPDAQSTPMYLSRTETREFMLKKIEAAFTSIGYTFDDLEADEKAVGRNTDATEQAAFFIPVEFKLENGTFLASIIKSDIRYTSKMSLTSADLLPYFGAAGTEASGYMVVPDGSGALINFNSRTSNTVPYTAAVYGTEDLAQPVWTKEKTPPVVLPVFGMKDGNSAFLAEIEGGAALAEISADVSGPGNALNHIGVQFAVRKTDSHPIYSTAEETININLVQPGTLEGTFSIRYSFLDGDKANYTSMAQTYQQSLLARGILKPLSEQQRDPVHVINVYGLIDAKESMLGVPVSVQRALTTAQDAQTIAQYFLDHTSTAPILNYVGSFNGGIRHSLPDKIAFEKKLGGEKGMQQLAEFCKANGVELFFEGGISMTERDTITDTFHAKQDAAYFLNKKYGMVYSAELATFYHSINPRYVLSPKRLPSVAAGFADQISGLQAAGLSPRYMGQSLNGDFNVESPVFRDQAESYYIQAFKAVKENNLKLLLTQGNSYVYAYADYIANLPLTGGDYPIESRSIPFVQMVLHGYISYTGPVINDYSSPEFVLLKSLETGSGLYSSFIMADYSNVIGTDYSYLRSSLFADWSAQVAENYETVYAVLHNLNNVPIVGHEQLADDVFCTRYANGRAVLVNYSDADYVSEHGTVKGNNFLLSEVN